MPKTQQTFEETIEFLGYTDMEIDDILKETGKIALQLCELEQAKRDEMAGYNESIKDLKQRIQILSALKASHRRPSISAVNS
jgi:hypothetical protein